MSSLLTGLSWPLMLAGLFFFISGAVGLLRFPDLFSRLHAVTKADTVGFGLIAAGLMCRSGSWREALVLLVVWLLVLASGATNCQLLARYGETGHAHMGEHRVPDGER